MAGRGVRRLLATGRLRPTIEDDEAREAVNGPLEMELEGDLPYHKLEIFWGKNKDKPVHYKGSL